MKLTKKLIAASVAVMFVSSPVYADEFTSPQTTLDMIDDILDDSLDIDDAMVRVVSSAINLAPINASVSLSGARIDFNEATTANATATATANSSVAEANATVSAITSAVSGNSIKTSAIGSVNDTSVTTLNELAYLRDNTMVASFDLSGEVDQETVRDSVEGGAIAGEYGFLTGLGGVIVGESLFGNEDNGTAVFQAAYNSGDINSAVVIATADTGEYYTRGLRDNLNINDLAITTNAIGAVNSGLVNATNSIVVDVKTSIDYKSTVGDVTNTQIP
jgi:hypothetical protein